MRYCSSDPVGQLPPPLMLEEDCSQQEASPSRGSERCSYVMADIIFITLSLQVETC